MKIVKFAFYLLWKIVRTLFVWLVLPVVAVPFLIVGMVVVGVVWWVHTVWTEFNKAFAK